MTHFDWNEKLAHAALAAILLVSVGACDQKSEQNSAEESAQSRGVGESIAAMKMYDTMPEIRQGEIFVGESRKSGKDGPEDRAEAARVLELMRELLGLLATENLAGLNDHISRSQGLYVDLKAHKTFAEIEKDVRNPTGYLRTYYLNSESLRERTDEPEQLAIRDVFKLTRVVTADVYLQSDRKQCELRLRLEDAPSKSYYLNNPVFIQENGQWFIYRLF